MGPSNRDKEKWHELMSSSRDASKEQKWELAIRKARSALLAARELKQQKEQAESLVRIAQCAGDLDDVALAKKCVSDLLLLLKAAKTLTPSPLLIDCADVFLSVGLFPETEELMNQYVLSISDSSRVASQAIIRLGDVWLGLREPNRALLHFEDAAQVAKAAKAQEELILSLQSQALSHDLLGNYAEAVKIYRLSCKQARRFKLYGYVVSSLMALAALYEELGNAVWAKRCNEDALIVVRKVEPESEDYAHQVLLGPKVTRERRYERMLKNAIAKTSGRTKMSFNRMHLFDLRSQVIALNGLGRYEEAQEVIVGILDSTETTFELHWPFLETVLSELVVALNGLKQPEIAVKAEALANRLYAIRTEVRLTGARKRDRLTAVATDLVNFVRFFGTRRIKVFSIRGRTVNFETRTVSGKGVPRETKLTKTEATILQCLIAYQGKDCPAATIAKELYPGAQNDSVRTWQETFKVHVTHIRRKLGDERGGNIIRAVPHVGWCLADQ
jgi:tetratricopeptide (TPR) repeat protein/DNA-binding winged helix-turn-helix (wHTH) protein